MKKLILFGLIMLLFVSPQVFAGDHSVYFGFTFGFGKTSGSVKNGDDSSRYCRKRNRVRDTGFRVGYQYNDVEVHFMNVGADNGPCSSTVSYIGVGGVLDNESYGRAGDKNIRVAATTGLAIAFEKNNLYFDNHDVMGPFILFGRLSGAYGLATELDLESGLSIYGTDHVHTTTVDIGLRNWRKADNDNIYTLDNSLEDPEQPSDDGNGNGKHDHCDNGRGNGGEGCSPSDHGNDDESY